MAANQIEHSRLEKRSVIKFLFAEKCKLCKIHKRKKNVRKWVKHGFATTSPSHKNSHWTGNTLTLH